MLSNLLHIFFRTGIEGSVCGSLRVGRNSRDRYLSQEWLELAVEVVRSIICP
jgi:hypothetical protein